MQNKPEIQENCRMKNQESYVLSLHVCELQHGSLHPSALFAVDPTKVGEQPDFVLLRFGARAKHGQ